MKTITSILTSFKTISVNKFDLIITREEKALSKAFIIVCKDCFDLIEGSIKEDENLQEYRKEWNGCFTSLGLKNSSYTFANMLKIGKLYDKDSLWLFGFKNLTCLAIGLASLQSVPSCNGVASLEIVATNKPMQSIRDRILEIDNTLESKELRALVNEVKGMPVKEPKKDSLTENTSKPVNSTLEDTALSLAKSLVFNGKDDSYLIAFVANIFNLDSALSTKLEKEFTIINKNKRISLGN